MTPAELIAAFDVLADAPDGVKRLRELVLSLAVRGKLVEQDPDEGTASDLLDAIDKQRRALSPPGRTQQRREFQVEPLVDQLHAVPPSWRWIRIQDLGQVVGGGTPSSSMTDAFRTEGGIPWITPADMRQFTRGKFIAHGSRGLSEAGLRSSSAQLLPEGSVVFSSRAPIGYVAIAANPIATNQGFKSVVPAVPAVAEYLRLYLLYAGPHINSIAPGTTFKEVSGAFVSAYPCPLPPLAEQRRIVARVDELMALLDQLEAARTARDEVRRAARDAALAALRDAPDAEAVEVAWGRVSDAMDELFVEPEDVEPLRQAVLGLAVRGRLVPQDPTQEPASLLLHRITTARQLSDPKWKRLSPVPLDQWPFSAPSGWTFARLDDVADLGSGITKGRTLNGRATRMMPYLRVANVKAGSLELDTLKFIEVPLDEVEKYRVVPGDVLLTEGGDWDKLGRSAVWHGEVEDCIHQNHIFRARPVNQDVSGSWLSMYTNSPDGRTYFQSCSKQTTNLASINKSQLRDTPVPLPPASEQRRIVERFELLKVMCDELERRLSVNRDLLCQVAVAAVHHLDV